MTFCIHFFGFYTCINSYYHYHSQDMEDSITPTTSCAIPV